MARTTLTPVAWSEGMFLKPHHFQAADVFQAAVLSYHLRAVNAFHWGVGHFRADPDALDNMVLRIQRCEVVLPDGLVVRIPEDVQLDDQSFQDAFPAQAPSLGVFLAVRVLDTDAGVAERYAVDVQPRRDLMLRDNDAQVDVLVPKPRLVFTNDARDDRLAGFESVKVAEVRRTGLQSPRFAFSPQYVPPALSVHASPPLFIMLKELLDRVSASARALGQHRRERGPDKLGYGVGDLEQLLARQALSQYIPAIQHALLNESIHPFSAYGELAQLHGALTSFFPDEDPARFPDYDHLNIGGCFGTLCESIRRLLDRLLPVNYEEIVLRRVRPDDFQFSAPVKDALFARDNVFVLAIAGGPGEDVLRKRIDTQAKLSSVPDVQSRVGYADRGVPVRFMPVPPAQIPRYAGYSYFQLDTADRRWTRVKDAASLALFLPDAEANVEARVFVIFGERLAVGGGGGR